jgi:hypothetical protein
MLGIERGWLPVRAALHPTGLYFALRQIGPEHLLDAFLYDTVARVAAPETIIHFNKDEIGKAPPDTAPSGFIFHVGRSGSTLLSQSLKHHQNVVVYGEPLAVNEILVPPHTWSRADIVAALRSLGALFAHHAQKPYVLKLTAWNTLFSDILTEAFPDTPWIFNVRDPVEVGVSILRELPGWFRSDEETSHHLARVVDSHGASKSPEEYIARAYGALCSAVARLDPQRGRLVAYDALPAAVWDTVAPHFSLSISADERSQIAEAARTYSKGKVGQPREFKPDGQNKRAAASTELLEAIDAFAQPELDRVKSLFRS